MLQAYVDNANYHALNKFRNSCILSFNLTTKYFIAYA